MKSPSEIRQKVTPLLLLNFVLLQWLGIRLAKVVCCSLESGVSIAIDWQLLVGVVPLTGWWSNYVGPITRWDITKRRHRALAAAALQELGRA